MGGQCKEYPWLPQSRACMSCSGDEVFPLPGLGAMGGQCKVYPWLPQSRACMSCSVDEVVPCMAAELWVGNARHTLGCHSHVHA